MAKKAIIVECYSKEAAALVKKEPAHVRAARKSGPVTKIKFKDGVPAIVEQAPEVKAAVERVKAIRTAPTTLARSAVQVVIGARTEQYSSLFKAFVALGLPENKHVKFRAELKKEGKKLFEHNGTHYNFSTI
jgi:hypothetical protein